MFIGYYNYTVLLTYFGLCSAVYGMMQAMKNDYRTAIICLLICGLCDMFDGMIARTNKTRSEDATSFGVQIDSLCDLVCFGVFPVIIGAESRQLVHGAGGGVFRAGGGDTAWLL